MELQSVSVREQTYFRLSVVCGWNKSRKNRMLSQAIKSRFASAYLVGRDDTNNSGVGELNNAILNAFFRIAFNCNISFVVVSTIECLLKRSTSPPHTRTHTTTTTRGVRYRMIYWTQNLLFFLI